MKEWLNLEKNYKIIIFSSIIILSIGFILFKENVGMDENVHVVSRSENESIETPKNINKEVEQDKDEVEKIEQKSIDGNSEKLITIFISGEVEEPGIVTIEPDKRLSDAIDELGGFTSEADLNKINLAMKIEDEKHYIIPKIGEIANADTNTEAINSNAEVINNDVGIESNNQDETKKININIAGVQELDTLPGIGEATANKIMNYRDEKGKFNDIEEIKNVNGIGDKKYEEIKDKISVN